MRRGRMIIISLLLLVLTSCNLAVFENTYIVPENAFSRENEKEVFSAIQLEDRGGILRFPVIADAHYGREEVDKGVIRYDGRLADYLGMMAAHGDFTPMLMLGDILDNGSKDCYEETSRMIRYFHDLNPEMEIIYTCGNHELEDDTVETWEEYFGNLLEDDKLNLTGIYTIADKVAIYNVNSAYRIFGRDQLGALETAMKANRKRFSFSLMTNHIPLSSSKVNQTLFNFIIGDERERNAMLRIMDNYGPSFMLSGHHHKGNTFNLYSESAAEFIFSAFHKKGELFESPGRWYLYQIDTNTWDCDIWGFSIRTPVRYGSSNEELDGLAEEHIEFRLK